MRCGRGGLGYCTVDTTDTTVDANMTGPFKGAYGSSTQAMMA